MDYPETDDLTLEDAPIALRDLEAFLAYNGEAGWVHRTGDRPGTVLSEMDETPMG